MKQLIGFFLLLLISCGADESKIETIENVLEDATVVIIPEEDLIDEMDSTAQFLTFYRKFMAAFMGDSETALDQYFHPE